MSGQMKMFPSLVHFVALQRETNNNVRKSPLRAVRCLFGVPDHRETKVLIEEELRKQRESFFDRWDFDTTTFRSANDLINESSRKRTLENDENDVENPSKRLMVSEPKLSTVHGEDAKSKIPRRILQPRNGVQSHITDFWSSKKITCEERLVQKPQKYPSRQLDLI